MITRQLPREFDFGHDLAFALHNLLARFVVEGETAQLHRVEFTLDELPDEALEGEELWRWCEENGHRADLEKATYRNLVFGLLSDMCQFLYEGLKCSEKGKLSVAYSLLRKPLQDHLYYLERILADWPSFFARFQQGAEFIDYTKLKDAKKATLVGTIGCAMDRAPMGRFVEPEVLYEIRYEKNSDIGLDPIFSHAHHLVTTHKHYETPAGNINFIFCQQDDRERLWRQLYLQLPVVLMHAVLVVSAIFNELAPEFASQALEQEMELAGVGFFLWALEAGGTDKDGAFAALTEIFSDVGKVPCRVCGKELVLEGEALRSFWDSGTVVCVSCLESGINTADGI